MYASFILGKLGNRLGQDKVYYKMLLGEFARVLKRGSGRMIIFETKGSIGGVIEMAGDLGFKLEDKQEKVVLAGSPWGEMFLRQGGRFSGGSMIPVRAEFSI